MEQKEVRGSKTSYYNKSEKKTIERISKLINLGVNSPFNVGDIAYILSDDEYKELIDNNTGNDELMNDIKRLSDDNNKLDATNKELSDKVAALSDEVASLTAMISEQEQELNKYSDLDIDKLNQSINDLEIANKELSSKVTNRDEYIIYLELLQSDYKLLIQYLNICNDLQDKRNVFNRLINKDVASDIDKPTLELIDFKGNVSDKENAPIINITSNKDVNSE